MSTVRIAGSSPTNKQIWEIYITKKISTKKTIIMSPSRRSSSSSDHINGPRPPPLKLNKDSHAIHKPTQRNGPVIIYTHSPKIIHTQARDFMALVQRLTGNSTPSPPVPKHNFFTPNSTDLLS